MGSSVHPGMNLSLPKVNVGTESSTPTELSLTDVPFLLGFFENVYFEPWDESELGMLYHVLFENIKYWRLGYEEQRQGFEYCLENMRKVINRKAQAMLSKLPHSQGTQSQSDNRISYPTCKSMEHIHLAFLTGMFDVLNLCYCSKEDSYINIIPSDEIDQRMVKDKHEALAKSRLRQSSSSRSSCGRSMVVVRNGQNSKPFCAIEYESPRLNLALNVRSLRDSVIKDFAEAKARTAGFDALQDAVGLSHLFVSKHKIDKKKEGGSEKGEAYYEVSSKDMCKYLNYMFCDLEHFYKDLRTDKVKTLKQVIPIAKTLSRGLTSSTGVCVLNMHQNVIGFEIVGSDTVNRLRIRTTPLIRCDHQQGAVALLLGLAGHGEEKHTESPEFSKLLERLVKPVIYAAQERMKDKFREIVVEDDADTDSVHDASPRPVKKKRLSAGQGRGDL